MGRQAHKRIREERIVIAKRLQSQKVTQKQIALHLGLALSTVQKLLKS